MLEEKFDVNPLLEYGLPSFGFKAMTKYFAQILKDWKFKFERT